MIVGVREAYYGMLDDVDGGEVLEKEHDESLFEMRQPVRVCLCRC